MDRRLPLGRHPLLRAFPGLDRLPTAKRHEPDPATRKRLYADTWIELVSEDLWMYVAPWKVPRLSGRARRFRPVVAPNLDCIVVGEAHLRTSSELVLFLDVFHELCHIRQRHNGLELFDRGTSYVERPTEVEAYRFVVEEGHRLHVPNEELREYLRVEWITEKEFGQLLDAVGVPRT